MIDHVEPRNRAERRAASRRTRKVAALGSGAILAMGVAGTATTLLSAAPAGAAAPIVVDSLTDDGTGTTLRDAITQANADAGADVITFQAGLTGTITVSSDLPHITEAVDIQGPGASVITVDGAEKYALFNFYSVDSGADRLTGLTVTHGVANNNDSSSGGGVTTIDSGASLTIADAVITANHADNDGGGVQSNGSSGALTIQNTTISGNTADSGGGGLYAWGDGSGVTVTIENSTISDNTAGDRGGGVYVGQATASITGTTITGNTAGSSGGGVYARSSTVSIADSTISGHNVAANEGGGVYGRNSEITVAGTTVSDNEAGNGGGFYLSNSPTTIESTTISGNTTTDDGGGGIKAGYYQPDEGEPGATAAGPDATLTIRNSTVSNNTAQYYGGGLYITLAGATTIENSTISGNHAKQAGGIYGGYAGITLTQVTITNNGASDPNNGVATGGVQFAGTDRLQSARAHPADAAADEHGGGPHARGRADVHAAAVGTLDSVGTIIAGNVGEDVGVSNGDATLTSDHSVLGVVDSAINVVDQGGTQLGVTDAGLNPLADNGGPTQTHSLQLTSPALNRGPVPVPAFPGNDFDQRGTGFARVVDGVVDVGAYEVQPPPEPAPEAVVITPRFTG